MLWFSRAPLGKQGFGSHISVLMPSVPAICGRFRTLRKILLPMRPDFALEFCCHYGPQPLHRRFAPPQALSPWPPRPRALAAHAE